MFEEDNVMRNYKIFFIVLALLLLIAPCSSAIEQQGEFLYEVRVPFTVGGEVLAALPDGRTIPLGSVFMLPDKSRWPSYTASSWGKPGTVTASAVNALHLLVSIESGKGRTISLIPKETIAPAAGPGASIVLDMKAGTGIFGAWAPPTGTLVTITTAAGSTFPLSSGHIPKEGDVLSFRVSTEQIPYFVEIENRTGGRVVAWGKNGADLLARVIRPVQGVGRFEGTLFQEPGRIRASHAGVIDVSTSPNGVIGGFQIIPWDHALKSKEMQGVWQMTQWLILAAPDGKSMLGGKAPLFGGGLIPGPAEGEKLWDFWSTYGRRPLVLCRLNGGPWEKLPIVSGKVDDGLKNLTHIRIYFPIGEEPLL